MFDAVQQVTRVLNTIGDVLGFLNVLMHFNCGVVECEFEETPVSHEHCHTINTDDNVDSIVENHNDCYVINVSSDSIEDSHDTCFTQQSQFTNSYSLKNFLTYYNDIGVQIKNCYEVKFHGINTNLNNIVFYIQNITLPGLVYNMTEIKYDGHVINVPVNYDYNHDISMTIINDAQGYIYNFLFNYFKLQRTLLKLDSNCTLIVSAISGINILNFKTSIEKPEILQNKLQQYYTGLRIKLYGIRFTEISGLEFGVNNNEIQTFTVAAKCLNYEILRN